MVYYLLVALYLLVCLLLLLVVLLQQGKGGDMASAFGGGGSSQTAFGARAGATVLTRATTVLGALFMLGAIMLGDLRAARPGLGAERREGARAADAPRRRPRRLLQRRRSSEIDRSLLAEVAELADAPA